MEWLDKIVVSAEFHRFHGAVYHVIGAHHQHDAGRACGLDLPQHFNAIHAREDNIEQCQIRLLFVKNLKRLFTRARNEDFKPFLAQSAANGAEGQGFVIDHQN